MTETPALGDLIRESRLALGYSLGQLATKVGRTAATVRSWERGEAVPNEESRAALESVLDIDPGQLDSLLLPPEPYPADTEDDSEEVHLGSVSVRPESVETGWPQDDGVASDEDLENEGSAGTVAAVAAAIGTNAAAEVELVQPADGDASEPPGEDETFEPEDGKPGDDQDAAQSEETPSDAEPDYAAEPEGSDTELPLAPLVTDGLPLDDEEATSDEADDDTDDTLEGIAAVTPFEVDPALVDEPTEAVVVPVVAAVTGVATQTRSVVTVSEPKELRSGNPLRAFFDPQKRWLYWLRALLTLAVAVVLLFVLVWAAGELFDALGQVLDSIEPTEVDDGGIDALGWVRTLI